YAHFNGVSFRVEKRYSDGLFFLGNYQLSKSIDNGSGEIEANDTAYAWDLSADKGYARYDQRHRAAISFGYELPFGPGKPLLSTGGPVAYVFGGWQVQGIVRVGSGFPLSVGATSVCQCGNYVDRKSTRLNSSHDQISYAVFCLKKKKKKKKTYKQVKKKEHK